MPAVTDYQRIDAAYANALRADEATPGQSPQYWQSLADKGVATLSSEQCSDLALGLMCGWRPAREVGVRLPRAMAITLRGRAVRTVTAEVAMAAGLTLTSHGRVLVRGDAVGSWSFA